MTEMISLASSVSALDRCQRLLDTVLECYRSTVADLASFTFQLDEDGGPLHRDQLFSVAARMQSAPATEMPVYRDGIRQLLENSSGTTTVYVARLQRERDQTERALEALAASLLQADDDYDGRLRATVEQLRGISRMPVARGVGDALRMVADSVERGFEQIRRQHQLTISQCHNEIRALRQQTDPAGKPSEPDDLSRLLGREETTGRILASKPGQYAIAVLRLRGIRVASLQQGVDVGRQLIAAFVVRLRNTIPVSSSIGRWSEDTFVALLPAAANPASTCRNIIEHVNGQYACNADGRTLRLAIDVSACVLDSGSRDTPLQILERLESSVARI